VPQATFRTRRGGAWVDVSTRQLFDGKNVVCFALPGAFTPTCSASHLPGYDGLAADFKARGIDDIVCMSVNDAFVMNAWAADQGVKNVTMIADGNGEFAEKMGMLVDKSDLGFGKRSWRYSMLVRDGVIERLFCEPEVAGDPYEVSDAEHMLRAIDPEARPQRSVSILTRRGCPHCARAKEMLAARSVSFEEVVVGKDVAEATLCAVSGSTAVPQIFIDGSRIGGADALEQYLDREAA